MNRARARANNHHHHHHVNVHFQDDGGDDEDDDGDDDEGAKLDYSRPLEKAPASEDGRKSMVEEMLSE